MTTLLAVPVNVATGPITGPATTPEEATIPALSSVVLTGSDAERIQAALTATIAPATRTVYTCVWGIWERWCQTRLRAMPADPATICAYLAERADQGVAAGTLTQICSAIAYRHRTHGYTDPTITDAVRQVRCGLRRLIGTAPRRQARPLSTTEIRQILDHIDRTTPKGARDAALIMLGFASAMRRSELAALDLTDISHRPGGILITIRRSKTDQDGAGQVVVGVAPGQHKATDPVAALAAWYRQRGSQPGPVFTNLRARLAHDPISGEAISRMLRTRARCAGVEASRITSHSLRAGHATEAARAGVPLDRIAAQTRHKRVATLLERYIRPTQALQTTSSNDLGL